MRLFDLLSHSPTVPHILNPVKLLWFAALSYKPKVTCKVMPHATAGKSCFATLPGMPTLQLMPHQPVLCALGTWLVPKQMACGQVVPDQHGVPGDHTAVSEPCEVVAAFQGRAQSLHHYLAIQPPLHGFSREEGRCWRADCCGSSQCQCRHASTSKLPDNMTT